MFHLLYGREWIGLLLEIKQDEVFSNKTTMALVKMVPGTVHEHHFTRSLTRHRVTDNMGYVSLTWLRKLEKDA